MAMYRKIPVLVEAVQFVYTEEGIKELKTFCGDNLGDIYKARHVASKAEVQLKTLEDGNFLKVKHIATEGDFIVKGVNGEFWAVKPDIFKQTYEEVSGQWGDSTVSSFRTN